MTPFVSRVESEFVVTQQRWAVSRWCKILPKATTKLRTNLNFALTLRCKWILPSESKLVGLCWVLAWFLRKPLISADFVSQTRKRPLFPGLRELSLEIVQSCVTMLWCQSPLGEDLFKKKYHFSPSIWKQCSWPHNPHLKHAPYGDSKLGSDNPADHRVLRRTHWLTSGCSRCFLLHRFPP